MTVGGVGSCVPTSQNRDPFDFAQGRLWGTQGWCGCGERQGLKPNVLCASSGPAKAVPLLQSYSCRELGMTRAGNRE
jgi:hypothetical protein